MTFPKISCPCFLSGLALVGDWRMRGRNRPWLPASSMSCLGRNSVSSKASFPLKEAPSMVSQGRYRLILNSHHHGGLLRSGHSPSPCLFSLWGDCGCFLPSLVSELSHSPCLVFWLFSICKSTCLISTVQLPSPGVGLTEV